jgi:hypothetical protein
VLKPLYIATSGYLRKPFPTLVIAVEGYLQYEYPPTVVKKKGLAKKLEDRYKSNDDNDMLTILNIFLQCKN